MSILNVTVLVDGKPEKRDFPAHEKIREVIRSLLNAPDKHEVDKFQLVDLRLGPGALDPNQSLHDAGVKSGDTLSLTKKDGGGGSA